MAALMILLAFSGLAHNSGAIQGQSSEHSPRISNMVVGNHSSFTTLNAQEMNDLHKFMEYNLIHYGLHSGKLDKLQHRADMNFLTWYMGNFNQIPSAHRGINKQNASVMLPMWENESPRAQSEVQAVTNYEVSQITPQNEINITYVVNNHLGTLVSNKTTMHNNQSANILTYRYTKDNQTLVYGLIDQKGTYTSIDPYIRLNAFTIHWGFGGIISGTSYNIYFTFDNYNNADTFKNFLASVSTIKSSVDWAASTVGFAIAGALIGSVIPGPGTAMGAAIGAFVGVVKGLVTELIGANTDPFTVDKTINRLFANQEATNGQFNITYTLNAWEWGLVPEFSWWGWEYMVPSNALIQIYKNVEFENLKESDFVAVYHYLDKKYGTNDEHYLSNPNWYDIEAIVSGWT